MKIADDIVPESMRELKKDRLQFAGSKEEGKKHITLAEMRQINFKKDRKFGRQPTILPAS